MKAREIIVAAASILALASCKKEVSELPPATQSGANTFGAKVNGNLWVPHGFGSIPDNSILTASWGTDHDLHINARNFESEPNEKEFEIFLKGAAAPGVYLLNTDVSHPAGGANYGYYIKRNITPQNEWITSSTHTGSVTITTIDEVNHFVSGTFEFNGMSLYNSDPLIVTEGRFDVKVQ